MAPDADAFLVPFFGALQASVAVLLTIFAGVLAAQFNLLSEASSRDIAKVCVKLFLPALLIVNVGSELNAETGMRYVAILVWGLLTTAISLAFGMTMTKIFKMPQWITPAIAFNNTTSLPLLLVQSLAATQLLDPLDSSGGAVSRAKSYFLMNSMISNSLTFSLGPKFLSGFDEDAPEDQKPETAEEEANRISSEESEAEEVNEETSLLPIAVTRSATRAEYGAYKTSLHYFHRLPSWAQSSLTFMSSFLNPAIVGAIIGCVVGLVPALHTLFFATQEDGGYLNAWLTSALQNIGDLFAALQVVVVGVKLSQSLLRMRKGEASGSVPWMPFAVVTVVRFLVWPAISIAVIYAVVQKTNWLGEDPVLWFCMMLMPSGPSALLLTAIADVSGAEEDERMAIAKFLTISYAISPIIFMAVVGSLKASEAALGS